MQLASDLRVNWRPNPGTAVPGFSGALPPVSGALGTGAGYAAKGWTYRDESTGNQYVNVGTAAIPSWAPIALGDSV